MLKKIGKIKPSTLLALFGLILLASVHLYLLSKTFYVDSFGNFRTAGAGYGDIPLHLTQITKFAFTRLGNLTDPIFYGARLQYPFVLNLTSGLLLRFSENFSFSVLFPVMALAVVNIVLLFTLYRKFLKSSLFACYAVWIFFLGSGMGGYAYVRDAVKNHQTFTQFSQELVKNSSSTITTWGAVYPNQNIDFGAPMSLVFLHQRTFFLGLFGFLLVTLLLLKIREKPRLSLVILAGVILGLLPLWHTHSLVAAFIIWGILAIFALRKKDQDFLKNLSVVGLIGVALALPQLLFLMSAKGGSFLSFRLGWMVEPTIGSVAFKAVTGSVFSWAYLKFLWVNFGLILPIFMVGFVVAMLPAKRLVKIFPNIEPYLIKIFAAGALVTLLVVELVRFQPWDYDNNKLLVYFLLFATALIVLLLQYLYRRSKVIGIPVIIIVSVMILGSGIIDEIPRYMVSKDSLPVIFDVDSQQVAGYIKENIPEKDLILTGCTHLNPVSSLAGRDVLEGYPGWLWTRGIDYSARESQLKDFYSDPSGNQQLLKDYPIKYILVDDLVRNDWNANVAYFSEHYERVFAAGQFDLYRVSP